MTAIINNIVNEFNVSFSTAKSFVDFVIRHDEDIKKIYSFVDKMFIAGSNGMIEEENDWMLTFEEAAKELEVIFKCETGIVNDSAAEEMYSILIYESTNVESILNW